MNTTNLNMEECARYVTDISREDLEKAFVTLVDRHTEVTLATRQQDKYYEAAMEQSNFRADVLSEILDMIAKGSFKYKETKELCKAIKLTVEDSYVEL